MIGPAPEGKIVVGVDGSEESLAALRWAASHARRAGTGVEAITAWRPMVPGTFASDLAYWDFSGEARRTLEEAIGKVRPEAPEVTVRERVIEGPTPRVLVEACGPADLLVVGSRGHGGFSGLLLGSVSDYCANHAPCSVMIVRPPRGAGPP
jgi:nucleotide-binding universal stress UspA family protein